MAKKTERTREEWRAEWESIREGPFGPRWRFVHKAIAGDILTPAEMSAEVQLLAKAKRRLESLCSNSAAFDEVWERGGEFYQRTPCHCDKCGGKRKWPSYYLVNGVSLECLIDQHADLREVRAARRRRLAMPGHPAGEATDRRSDLIEALRECLLDLIGLPRNGEGGQRSVMEIGYTVPRAGCFVTGTAAEVKGMCGAMDQDAPILRERRVCEACQTNRCATRQRYCAGCLKEVTVALKDAGWPPRQMASYLSLSNAFGGTAA